MFKKSCVVSLVILCLFNTIINGYPAGETQGVSTYPTLTEEFVFQLPGAQENNGLRNKVSQLTSYGGGYDSTKNVSTVGRSNVDALNVINTGNVNTKLQNSNRRDPDAIIYPDDVVRDSYGNPVTPYAALPDDKLNLRLGDNRNSFTNGQLADIGHMTDVNKDEAGQTKTQNTIGQFGNGLSSSTIKYDKGEGNGGTLTFVIPSYASGITGVDNPYKSNSTNAIPIPNTELLPPLSSGNYNYPQLGNIGNRDRTHIVATSSPPSTNIRSEYPLIGNTGNVVPVVQNIPTGTISGVGVVVDKRLEYPTTVKSVSSTVPIVQNIPLSRPANEGKYTGSFGGAPGILGDQKLPGYGVTTTTAKPVVLSISADFPKKATITSALNSNQGQYNSGSSPISGAPQTPSTSLEYPKRTPEFSTSGIANQGQQNTQIQQGIGSLPVRINVPQTTETVVKYTGSFGGPPGVLSPYDNLDKRGNKSINKQK